MENLLGILRAALAAGGGYLVGKGVIDTSMVEPISGAIITIIVAIWSVLSKSDKFPLIK